jgi:transcriptional regulator GlxA family with amidase domain
MRGLALASIEPSCTVRRYSGEHSAHAHDHAQVLYALQGRMELEVGGREAFVDTACGIVIPAGMRHGFLAAPASQMLVIDAPDQQGLDRMRRFAVPPQWRAQPQADAMVRVAEVLQAPGVISRRNVDLERLAQTVRAALHEDWPTSRLAAMCHLSTARFHERMLALAGATPQAWVRGLRLDRAQQWIAHGLPLDTVALQCGYATASALAYALRRERGVGARDLRGPVQSR